MLTIRVIRNGELQGTSIIPSKNIHNPYFNFGAELTERNMDILVRDLDKAREMYRELIGNPNQRNCIPEYTMKTLCLWIGFDYDSPLSMIEAGCINGIQVLLFLFIVISYKQSGKDMTINTTSECGIRALQLVVARGILKSEEIEILDTFSNEPFVMENF